MYSSHQILDIVTAGLATIDAPRRPAGLYDPVSYVMGLGGKRIRPVLALMGYNIFADDPQSILTTALGLETYHNYTLLHDDLMDRADVRRGKPTVHRVWNDNTAILSGDSMLVLAYQRVAACAPDKLPQALELFTRTALEIGEGQQYDMEFETRDDVTEAEYMEMIRLKTSVLLACALKMGALLAGAPAPAAHTLYIVGERLGLAFQLQDDYLDVYGDFAVFGKKIGGDILCNKKTYMLINALTLATPAQRAELEGWIAATDRDPAEKIAAVTALYNAIGVPQLAQRKINECFAQAMDALDSLTVPEERKQVLRQYMMEMLNRKS